MTIVLPFSLQMSPEIVALRNRVVKSLEASPVPVSIFTIWPLIGQQGVEAHVVS